MILTGKAAEEFNRRAKNPLPVELTELDIQVYKEMKKHFDELDKCVKLRP